MLSPDIVSFVANETIPAGARVKFVAGSTIKVELADAYDVEIGTAILHCGKSSYAANTAVGVKLIMDPGTRHVIAASALAAGAIIKRAADGKVDDTGAGEGIGIACEAATAAGDVIEALWLPSLAAATAPSVTVANSATPDGNATILRAPGTRYREISRTTEQHNWNTKDRGLEEPMDDVNKQEESRFFDMETSTAIWLMRNIRISREVRVAGLVQDPAIWGKQDATEEYSEANLAAFNFAEDAKAIKRLMRKRQEPVNAMALSLNLLDLITGSEKLRHFFFGANGGSASIDEEMIARKFKLKYVLVGQTSYDTTKPGKDSTDDNLQWAWADDYIWFGNIVGGPPEAGGAGRTFVLDELTGGELYVTESYRDESIRSDRLRVRQDDDTNVVNENSGILLKVNGLS